MSANTGGPAFPQHGWSKDPEVLRMMKAQGGMTMLDWYSGQLLTGYVAHNGVSGNFDQHAKDCYDLASAMLAEKVRRENPPTERISIGSDDQRKALEAFKLIENIDHPEFAAVRLAIANLASRFVVSGEAVVQEFSTTGHSEDSLEKVAKLEAANRELVEALDSLEVWGDELSANVNPPSRNCSCHINPPCNDCVDFTGQREAKQGWEDAKNKARAILVKHKGAA